MYCIALLPLYWRLLCTWSSEYKIINCNIFPYSYFPRVLLLQIMYIDLPILKIINCIINYNILPFSFIPHVIVKVKFCHYRHSVAQRVGTGIAQLFHDLGTRRIFPILCYLLSCIYSYKTWNVLTVLLTVILSHIHISLMFCYYISCIYIYRLINVLIVFIINYNIVPFLYFPHVMLLIILYIQVKIWNILTVFLMSSNIYIFPVNSFILIYSVFPWCTKVDIELDIRQQQAQYRMTLDNKIYIIIINEYNT